MARAARPTNYLFVLKVILFAAFLKRTTRHFAWVIGVCIDILPQVDQSGFVIHFKRQRIRRVALIAATLCIRFKQFVELNPGVAASAKLLK